MCLRCARKPAVIMANILFHFIIPNQAIDHLFVVFEPPKFITMFICTTCMSSEHCRINQLVKSVRIECRTIWGGHMTCLLSVATYKQVQIVDFLKRLAGILSSFKLHYHLPTSLHPLLGDICHLYLISTAESWGTDDVCPVYMWVFIESSVETDLSFLALEGLIEPCKSVWPPDLGGSPLTLTTTWEAS